MAQKTISFWLRWDWRSWARGPLASSQLMEPSGEEMSAGSCDESPAEDRRNAVRHPCGLGISCQPIALMRMAPWPGVIQDVSATGIALALDHPLPVGAFLALHLPFSSGAKLVRARVVSARPLPDGGWVLGCTLDRKLHHRELRSLI